MATSEPFVELNEDEQSYSNSEKLPSKKKNMSTSKKVFVCKFKSSWSLPINLAK